MTELHDETNNGTATISLTPREVRRSTAAWMFARVAIPKATSVGLVLSTCAASSVTRAFHCALPPWASRRTPVSSA